MSRSWSFYAFGLFFIGLIFYLRREDRREGYPLEDDVTGRARDRRRRAAHRRRPRPSCCRSAMASSPRRPRAASRSTSPRGAPSASPARPMRRPAIRSPTASARPPGPIAPSVPTSTWTATRASCRSARRRAISIAREDADLARLAGGRRRRRGRRHGQRPVDRPRRPAGPLSRGRRRQAVRCLRR